MENVVDTSVAEFFDHSKTVSVSGIPFNREVQHFCEQNFCGNLGKSWTCPPAVEPAENMKMALSVFDNCLIFYTVYSLENRNDWQGMVTSLKDFQRKIFKSKQKIREKNPDLHFLVLGAGACQLCENCTYPRQIPCRNPKDAIFSVESFGIDAMKMMMENGLKANHGPDTVTYIGVLFYSEGSFTIS